MVCKSADNDKKKRNFKKGGNFSKHKKFYSKKCVNVEEEKDTKDDSSEKDSFVRHVKINQQ